MDFNIVQIVLGGLGGAILNQLFTRFRERPQLDFTMNIDIRCYPCRFTAREELVFSFRNAGRVPLHIEYIEVAAVRAWSFYQVDISLPVDPKWVIHSAPHDSFMMVLEPARIYAIDSTGRKWNLQKKNLKWVKQRHAGFEQLLEDERKRKKAAKIRIATVNDAALVIRSSPSATRP